MLWRLVCIPDQCRDCGSGKTTSTTSGLHRLVARAGLRPDVPDPLLRFLAGRGARQTSWLQTSFFLGTLPAPLFLFLADISFALVTEHAKKNVSANQIAITTIRRGAEILGFGLLFRLQEFLLGQPWAPWTDLLRVDVLNIIGISMMLMWSGLQASRHPRRRVDSGARWLRF